MTQLVVLNLSGDCQTGCPIVLAQIWMTDSRTPMQITGSLPAAPELEELYRRWQRLYEAVPMHYRWRRSRSASDFEIEEDDDYLTDVSVAEFQAVCQALPQHLNGWLGAATFSKIERQLRTYLNRQDEIRVVIATASRSLLKLPWHLWQFFEDYPRAELALSLPEYTRSLQTTTDSGSNVRILAILGNSQGIDTSQDQQLLEQLPNTELKLLIEPDIETLNQQLWGSGWDILFFAGHSSSYDRGTIQINPQDSLRLDQLRYGLKKAIERGLKLAIFNSCDGLELAWNLADLQIPQVVVMREPVPDRVAQTFLRHFLSAFSQGESFYLAVREAREKLQSLESSFFCATWLPVICQNPAEPAPLWQDWANPPETSLPPASIVIDRPQVSDTKKISNAKIGNIARIGLGSVAVTAITMGIRSMGLLQQVELWAYDRLLTVRPPESIDKKLLIVTIDEAAIQQQDPKQRQGSLSDQTLDQLLKILVKAQPRVIGIDLYRDFATKPQYQQLIDQLATNPQIISICKNSDAKYDPTGIAPSPEVPIEHVGFSDFLEDGDGVLRRQILFLDPDPASPCTAPYAFSTKITFRYLAAAGISPDFTSDGNLKLGKTVFPRLSDRFGGYQGIDAGGNQILLNYRAAGAVQNIAPQVGLQQLLKGQVRPEAIKDRIVLIGVTANSSSDIWTTPQGSRVDQRVPGVFIQAQMTSQLINAALNQRSLIWAWPVAVESVWVMAWGLLGGGIGLMGRRWGWRRVVWLSGLGWGGLVGGSIGLLTIGGWVPLIPASMALVLTGGLVYGLSHQRGE
jgi:CHASE2 domain-containing sensor protein